MSYHANIVNKIAEGPVSYTLYDFYAITNNAYKPKIRNFTTNCNLYYIKAVDKNETAGKVCCVPVNILEKILNTTSQPDLYDDLEYKQSLFKKVDKKKLLSQYNIFYKPIFTKPCVTEQGWEVTTSIKEESDNREVWLSNHDLSKLIKNYIGLVPKSYYMGVVYLSCFDYKNKLFMDQIYNQTALKYQIDEHVAKYEYLTGCIVAYSHWSSIIIDKSTKTVLHYCSGGNDPLAYEPNSNLVFYSTSKGLLQSPQSAKLTVHNTSKYCVFNQLTKKGFKVLMNVESSQILSGECGIYASLFIILYLIFKPSNAKEYSKLYNSFSFLGDKMMGLYRELLFWREPSLIAEVKSIPQHIVEKWYSIIQEQSSIINQINKELIEEQSALKYS